MTWRKHSGALLVACAIALGLATASTPAGAERTISYNGDRIQQLFGGRSLLGWQEVFAPTDAAGDNTPSRDPRGDIISGRFESVDGQERYTIRTRQPEAPTAHNWTVNGSELDIAIGVTKPDQLDFVGVLANDGTNVIAAVFDATTKTVKCTASPVFDGTNLGIAFPRSCVGSPTTIFVGAALIYETDSSISTDFIPDEPGTAPTPTSPPPANDVKAQGNLDAIVRSPGAARAVGWALDRNTQDATAVHIHLNGEPVAVATAQLPRPDVAKAVPGFGENRGFDISIPIGTAGPHRLCAYAINNQSGGVNTLIGCRAVLTAPFGRLDSIVPTAGGVLVTGWAIDPDTADPPGLHVYVDGVAASTGTAGTSRPDVGAAYPGYGDNHGFGVEVPVGEGKHTICAYVIDGVIGAQNIGLGCPVVTVTRSPFGSLDLVARSEGGFRVAGWAIDPDVTGPSTVHVYVDGKPIGAATAGSSRPDLAARFPAFGGDHGFDQVLPGSGRRVCVYAINQGAGSNTVLGCKDV